MGPSLGLAFLEAPITMGSPGLDHEKVSVDKDWATAHSRKPQSPDPGASSDQPGALPHHSRLHPQGSLGVGGGQRRCPLTALYHNQMSDLMDALSPEVCVYTREYAGVWLSLKKFTRSSHTTWTFLRESHWMEANGGHSPSSALASTFQPARPRPSSCDPAAPHASVAGISLPEDIL